MTMEGLDDLLKEKHEKIDNEAERKKAGVSYLVGLIRANWDEYVAVFNPKNEIPEEQLPKTIYDSVERLIGELTKCWLSRAGSLIDLIHGQEQNSPAIQLGWAKLGDSMPTIKKPEGSSKYSLRKLYCFHPTSLSLDIINDYRAAVGLFNLQQGPIGIIPSAPYIMRLD